MMMLIENPYGVFVRANACFWLLGECPYGAYHSEDEICGHSPWDFIESLYHPFRGPYISLNFFPLIS